MLNKDKHWQILFHILKDIFQSDIGKNLAFKGGTACYFFHNLDRFSTDLDFDLLVDGNGLDEKIWKILKKYGQVKKWNKLILSYAPDEVNIKIDINRKAWKNNIYEMRNFYGTDMRVQDPGTIFGNKLVALTERWINRDMYDAYFFFKKMFPINEKLILERTGQDLKKTFTQILLFLQKLPENYKVLDGLWEVLTEKQKYFVKNNLIKELISILELRIDF